jgi:hypothetical protein
MSLLAAASLAAAQGKDPLVGTWKLNLAKSTFPGNVPQAGTRAFEDLSGGFIYVKNDGFGPGPGNNRIVLKRDGKDYPITSLGQKVYVTIAFTEKSQKPFAADYVVKTDGNVTRQPPKDRRRTARPIRSRRKPRIRRANPSPS